MIAACLLAFGTGFLSLSMEILWVRLFGYTNHSMPQGFAFVLISFLIGIALGARIGKWFCDRTTDLWLVCGVTLLLSSVFNLLGPLVYAALAHTTWQLASGGLLIAMTALLTAVAFPIAHHLGAATNRGQVGRSISRVYVSNIMGATLGPLFTGLVLLSLVTTQQGFIVCSLLTFLLALLCFIKVKTRAVRFSKSSLTLSGMLVTMTFYVPIFLFEPHQLIKQVAEGGDLIQVVENQHGIITVYHEAYGGDIVAGGNVYDGRTNLDPVINSNGISRVIVLSALQDKPKRVLMVGLSIGSWLKIMTGFPGVEMIDVVEINPGYLDVISRYPAQELALLDPRVHIHIDDARRWLKLHPKDQYDLIVMNTTYHWRAYTGNLLSIEFLTLLKQHMNPGAVLAYNGTGSPDALKTAETVFSHAYLYGNFVIAAAFDWRAKLHAPGAMKALASLQLDGKPLFPEGSDQVMQAYLDLPTHSLSKMAPIYDAFGRKIEIITDRNLITEYKYGKQL